MERNKNKESERGKGRMDSEYGDGEKERTKGGRQGEGIERKKETGTDRDKYETRSHALLYYSERAEKVGRKSGPKLPYENDCAFYTYRTQATRLSCS